MSHIRRNDPLLSACGLNCGLCPRFHADGASRCPGCGGEGFFDKRPSCGVISCCQRHGGIAYCFLCEEYPCKKYDRAPCVDSFISHRNMIEDFRRAKEDGLEAYQAELREKMTLLDILLRDYNDGRRKSYFCLAANLLPLSALRGAMANIAAEATPDMPVKEKSALAAGRLQAAADALGIPLLLRKK